MASSFLKRLIDIVVSFAALLILMPVLLLVAILIKFDSEGEVIFRQARLGRFGKPFYIYKFRTMVQNAENIGLGMRTASDDPRITRVGSMLRTFSIDELPQLVNILKGEMSLVGPRPAPVKHWDNYSDQQKKRLQVRPGVTGWAQVNGRNTIPWDERIKKDIWYVENYSLRLDARIFMMTVSSVLNKKGIYSK